MIQRHQPYWSRLVLTLALSFVIGTAYAEDETTPEDIINKSIVMLKDDCDFACCYEVAGLYTKRFLEAVRKAIIASLRTNSDVNTVIRKVFGGKATTLAEVEALRPRELYAWHTYNTVKSVPAKYRYSKLEVLDVRHVSPDEIEYVVRMSGVKAEPSTKEEAFFRVVRENGQWRIDQ